MKPKQVKTIRYIVAAILSCIIASNLLANIHKWTGWYNITWWFDLPVWLAISSILYCKHGCPLAEGKR
jgi:hypothetical protein